jgi:hypothetical protein
MPTAEISFTALEGEKSHEVIFRLLRESSSENCLAGAAEKLAFANVGRTRWLRGESEGLSGVRIPAGKEIEIRLDVHYASFREGWGGGHKTFDVAFTPAPDHRYRLDLEWDQNYIDVRLLELAADGGRHPVPLRLEECRSGLFTIKSVPVEPG